MWPAVGCSKPAISRRQVVLPEPEGPSMAKNSPGRDVEIDVVDGAHGAEMARDVLKGDGGGHRCQHLIVNGRAASPSVAN